MKDFKKYFTINALPEDVFNALTNPLIITMWSGEPNVMSAEPGSEFEWFDGSICGKNLRFEQHKLIEQQWYFGEDDEKPSIVTIKLHINKESTSLELRHTNIPDEAYENIVEGWESDIISPLRDLLEE